jgi:hypothetical protein
VLGNVADPEYIYNHKIKQSNSRTASTTMPCGEPSVGQRI